MAPEQLKQPVEVTREELHELVWSTSMSKLAERFGISGNGLKKICDRLDVPYPSLGHWAKKAAGHDVPTKPLPKPRPDAPASATITPTPVSPAAPAVDPEALATIDTLKAEIGPEATDQTLLKPHATIAAWRKELDKDRRAAKRGAWNDPGELTQMHERQFRILDVILKALAARKIRVTKERGNQFVAELHEEKLEFGLRERQRKTATRRPSEERHHAFPGDFTFRDDMEGTGRLVFAFKRHLPGNLRHEWADTEDRPMEALAGEIAGTIIAAFPLLAAQTAERRAAERERQIAEHQRYLEREKQKCEDNRWRRFVEIAQQWENVSLARRFLEALKTEQRSEGDAQVGDRSLENWIVWTEQQLAERDPLECGSQAVYGSVSAITSWTYRD